MESESAISIPPRSGDHPSWVSPADSAAGRKLARTKRSLSVENLQQLTDLETNSIQEEIKARYARFSSPTGLVDEDSFHNVIGVADKKHTDLLYATLLREQPGNKAGLRIDYILERLLDCNSPVTQLGLIFCMCDKEGSGEIGLQEVKKFLEWSVRINRLKLSAEEVERMAAAIFEICAVDGKDTITMYDFMRLQRVTDQLGITHSLKFPIGSAPDFQKEIDAKRPKFIEELGRSTPSPQSVPSPAQSPMDSPEYEQGFEGFHRDPNISTSSEEFFDSNASDVSKVSHPESEDGNQKESRSRLPNWVQKWGRRFRYICANYWLDILTIFLWASANASLFVWRFQQYKLQPDYQVLGSGICTTKAAAETLKFNFALILLPICSRTMTFLRTHLLGFAPGVDRLLQFHRLVAASIVAGLVVHVGGHLVYNFRIVTDPSKEADVVKNTDWSLYKGKQATYLQLFTLPTAISGVAMLLTMFIAFPFAIRRVRGYMARLLPERLQFLASFNAFWTTHRLLLLNYVLIVWHGTRGSWSYYPTTSSWYYIVGPVMLYSWERLMHFYSGFVRLRQVEVTKAVIHPGNVLALHMVRPKGYQYKSGMYVYLHCPSISHCEKHPFTMTSSPFDDEITVHIKKAGDWTAALHDLFAKSLELSSKENTVQIQYPDGRKVTHIFKSPSESRSARVHSSDPPADSPSMLEAGGGDVAPVALQLGTRLFPSINLDGPYGAPSQEYRRYKVLMLIGAGIGITPFASITSEMLNRIQIKQLHPYREDEEAETAPLKRSASVLRRSASILRRSAGAAHADKAVKKGEDMRAFNTQKAYVIWTTRDQSSLTWFRDRMEKLSEFDHKGVVELHQYLTWISQDARSAMVKLGQALVHVQTGIDPITGMQTKVATHFGRPSWGAIFDKVAEEHPKETVGVFFCGPDGMAVDISKLAKKYSTSEKSTTQFDFRKEIF